VTLVAGTPGAVGTPVPLIATLAVGDASSYAWNFGDGTSASTTDGRTNHAYSTPGIYTVGVTATMSGTGVATAATVSVLVMGSPDTTPPAITPNVVGTLGANGWYVSDVTVSWSVVDNESAITTQSGCTITSITTDTAGTTLSCSAASAGGTSSQAVTINRDATAPTIACGAADALWHSSDVSIPCSASDGPSGLANAADASFTLVTNVPAGTETASAATDSRSVADAAGNAAMAGPIGGNQVDKQAPSISITAPTNTTYTLNQAVAAAYACADSGSGVASCVGTAPSGSPINTAPVGAKTFTVNAADNAGNAASVSVAYTIIYNFSGFFQPVDNLPVLNAVKAGIALPVKFSLAGNQGLTILAAGYPTSRQIACDSAAPIDDIEQTVTAGGSSLAYDATSDQYVYVWKTDPTWAGSCRQLIVRLADGTDHRANFKFK
jgi:PKD repeat protein